MKFYDWSAAGFPIEVEVISEKQTIPLENSCSRPHIIPSSELEISTRSENLLGKLSNLIKNTDVDLDPKTKHPTWPLILDLSIGTLWEVLKLPRFGHLYICIHIQTYMYMCLDMYTLYILYIICNYMYKYIIETNTAKSIRAMKLKCIYQFKCDCFFYCVCPSFQCTVDPVVLCCSNLNIPMTRTKCPGGSLVAGPSIWSGITTCCPWLLDFHTSVSEQT